MMRVLLAVLAAVALLACGDDDGGDGLETGGTDTTTTDGATTTAAGSSVAVDLVVEVNDGSATRNATLRCGPEGAVGESTGFLAEPAVATDACALLASNEEARTRLIEGAPADRMCTQIYGGPETATVEGSIDGQPVRTTVSRNDGCGIADWDLLTPLLGPPGS